MRRLIPFAVSALALIAASPAPAEWPIAADIPKPAPIALGLAGAPEPDVTRYLLVQGASAVSISPDGSRVAYSTSVTGQPQIWTVDAAGGQPRQITFGAGIDEFRWVPDGSGLLYGADTGGDERLGMNVISPDGTQERVALAKSDAYRYFGDFSKDGRHFVYATTERNGRDTDIHVADLGTGATREALRGRPGMYPVAWQPGGASVLVSEARGESANDLHLLDTATGRLRTLFKPKVASAYQSPAWKPDGSGFYLVTDDGGDFLRLAYFDLNAGKLATVEAPAHDVAQVELSGDGRFLVWSTDEAGFGRLHARDLTTGRDLALPQLPAGTYDFELAEAAPVAVIRTSGARAAGTVHVLNLATGGLRQVVAPNTAGLDLARMTVPVPVAFKARDGERLSGLLYMPEGQGRVPVYLSLHGGPSAHAQAGFRPDLQYLVARGIAVLDFNYRGSTGSGKRFASLNDKRLRKNELGDLADAVKWIAAQPRLDGKRVAVGGGSYGGYLTNAAVGAYPDLFVAAVSAVGVSDWVKALEGASPELQASDREEYGNVRDPADRAFLASLSPLNNASRVRTPMLVEHGANDPRDPVSESDAFVTAVRKTGTPVRYIRFPDEGHGISGLANRVHYYRQVADFLEERFGLKRAGVSD
jgi:dipeptidyl aminopeptidase/acylaminoacyl peptidase